jgi:hypothetical protein
MPQTGPNATQDSNFKAAEILTIPALDPALQKVGLQEKRYP